MVIFRPVVRPLIHDLYTAPTVMAHIDCRVLVLTGLIEMIFFSKARRVAQVLFLGSFASRFERRAHNTIALRDRRGLCRTYGARCRHLSWPQPFRAGLASDAPTALEAIRKFWG